MVVGLVHEPKTNQDGDLFGMKNALTLRQRLRTTKAEQFEDPYFAPE